MLVEWTMYMYGPFTGGCTIWSVERRFVFSIGPGLGLGLGLGVGLGSNSRGRHHSAKTWRQQSASACGVNVAQLSHSRCRARRCGLQVLAGCRAGAEAERAAERSVHALSFDFVGVDDVP